MREIGSVGSMGSVIGDQILFGCQRESGKILKRTNRRNINPGLLKLMSPEGILPGDFIQQRAEPFGLPMLNFGPVGLFGLNLVSSGHVDL
jgi:hypothetical protein